ncbi:ABC transporter ATP-binding protein (plasmid) [Paroceanicella profunda]|uniref:ABC transporter ATP-binding protein n=1 Tax=Paroceanicella profunda TaxID=2579971 RepID=A0A5B8G4G4_9RHOB|nr:ABC transporter ATP-binding protein [Paroceanicella profunda]QDL93823.1 ABC transporter ATP-binding protein [Paroceanicella profunda]
MTAPGITLSGRGLLGGQTLFGPLTLALPAGRWTCLLGPSGAGKSSLLRLIAGLDTAVRLEGGVSFSDGAGPQGRIAYMAQTDLLCPWLDVLGNVALGPRLRGTRPDMARARALISAVGLEGREDARPGALSGGQRQRVALARTLMEDCPVVLLDEPFSALDARTRAGMQDLAARLLAGRTVLLVTHEPGEALRLAHRLLMLGDGALTEMPLPDAPPPRAPDAPDTLTAQGSLFRALLGTSGSAGAPA